MPLKYSFEVINIVQFLFKMGVRAKALLGWVVKASTYTPIKTSFFGKFLPNMGGWGHSFPNENHNFWTNENSPFVLPNLTKTLGWVGG